MSSTIVTVNPATGAELATYQVMTPRRSIPRWTPRRPHSGVGR